MTVIDDPMEFIAGIRNTYLGINDHVQEKNLGYVGSMHNLKFSISLTNGLRKLVMKKGVQRTPKQILLLIVSIWNSTKGGVDQTSRYLKHTQAEFDKFLSPTQRLNVDAGHKNLAVERVPHVQKRTGVQRWEIQGWKQFRKMASEVITFEDI
jgi:hypothetical protein